MGLNAYVGARVLFYFRLALTPPGLALYWSLCFILAFSYFIGMALSGGGLGKAFQSIGGYWMVTFFYLLFGFIFMDALRFLGRRPIIAPLRNALPTYSLTLAGTLAVCGALGAVAYGAWHARQITVAEYSIETVKPGPPGELTIALISDLHIGSSVNAAWLGRVVDRINGMEPDIVCIAGDIFDNNLNSISDTEQYVSLLRRIKAPFGAYACLGNHDVDRISFRQGGDGEDGLMAKGISQILEDSHIVLLRDEMVFVDGRFYVAGRRDARPIGADRQPRLSAAEVARGRDERFPLILLDHQPSDITGGVAAGADLILSGHTHKGQVFPARLATRRIFAIDYGYMREGTTHIVVSSGAGVWGPPVRIGSNSEVAVIHFKWYNN